MCSYNSYHPNLKLLAIKDLLPSYFKTIIPNSTISTWKKNPNFSDQLIGMDSFVAQDDFVKVIEAMNQKALVYKTCKAIVNVVSTYSTILNSLEKKKIVLTRHKKLIVTQINSLNKIVNLKRACSFFNITTNQYRYWKNSLFNCVASPINLCAKSYNHQLLQSEIDVIRYYFTANQFLHWPISSVYYQILRDKAAYFSIATCYNYIKILNIKRHQQKSRRKNHKIGLRASAPLEKLHMDITIFKTVNNAKVYLYLICDNFSRCILGYKVSTTFDVNLVIENIKEVKDKYSLLNNTSLIVDNGIENRTSDLNKFLALENITKEIAQLDINESNSMVKSVIKQLKYYHIYPKGYKTPADFIMDIDTIINAQRNRPLAVLKGLTPIEALNGHLLDDSSFKNGYR